MYKNQLKKTHFKAYENDELRMENIHVPESHFKDLKYWNCALHKKMSKTNTEHQNKLKCPHTAGRTSFAIIREEKRRKFLVLQVRTSMWLQEKENLVEYTKTHMTILLVKLMKWREYNQLRKVKMTVI